MNVGILTQIQASALYLLPVAVVLLGLARRKTFMTEVVMWIPGAIAFDLLTCLIASWALPLDVVVLVSRFVWLVAGVEILRRRKWKIGWTEKPTAGQFAVVLATGMAAFLLSAFLSRPTSIWDRPFHLPLVTMMRHQRLPFLTVFQARTVLHYHFAGNVIAVALQVFSFGRLHSSLALALMHDLVFAMVGISLAAWFTTISARKAWIVPGVLAVFLSGPFALQRFGMGSQLGGYSFLSLFSMSYRPGIAAAILFLVGAFGALGSRLLQPDTSSPRRATTVIFLCMAMLAISDEPSACLLGIGIGAVWLIHPTVLHRSRKGGFLILAGLAASVLVSNLAFQAALVPGGPVQNLHLVPLRSPGFSEPPLSLTTIQGIYALVMDIAPFLLIMTAAVGVSWTKRDLPSGRIAVFLGATLLTGLLGLTGLDMGGKHIENHRFMTICEVVFPIASLIFLARLDAGRWERIPLIGALLIPAVSSYHWAQYGPGNPDLWYTNPVECRTFADAVMFEKPRPTYVPRGSLYAFAGCRPVFFPGMLGADNSWSGVLANGYAMEGKAAFEILHQKFVSPKETLRAACPVLDDGDAACTLAKMNGRCVPSGTGFQTCELTPEDRGRLLGMIW